MISDFIEQAKVNYNLTAKENEETKLQIETEDKTEVIDNKGENIFADDVTAEIDNVTSPEEKKAENKSEKKENKNSDNIEKRLKDTQKTYQKEHQELLKLKKELEELKRSRESINQVDIDDSDDDLFSDTDVKDKLYKKEQVINEKAWMMMEDMIKPDLEDYDKIVYDFFEPALRTDSALRDEFLKLGKNPKVAYQLGKRVMKTKQLLENPDTYLEELVEKRLQNLLQKNNNSEIRKTLSNVNSASKQSAKEFTPDDYTLDNALKRFRR
jgi:hypothetical protein